MKQDISSVDVAALVMELSELIIGAKIGKIYQHSPDEIRITMRVTGRGRQDLAIEAGKRAHLTRHAKESEKLPQAFPMLLRKHLTSGRIVNIEQYDFDRIIKIHVERAGVKTFLLCEFFARGNIVLLDEENRIILPLKSISYKDRTIRRGEIYELPAPQLSPRSITAGQLEEIFSASTTDVVRTIATRLNMGGALSEEVCLRANIDKTTKTTELNTTDCEKIHKALSDMFSPFHTHQLKPHIVKKGGVNIDVLPFELQQYENGNFEKVYFDSFNDALDEYYGKSEIEKIAVKKEEKRTKLGLYERRLAQQKASLEKFKREEQKNIRIGEVLYQEYSLVEDILSTIRGAREKNYSWDAIKDIISKATIPSAKAIERIDSSTGTISVIISGVRANIDYRLSVEQNATAYYERAKKFTSKIKGATDAIKKTEQLMAKKETTAISKKNTLKKRKEKWYEQFKWFYSSDGFLVIGGRDADTNESVVKKYMEKRDIFFHTQYPGSPAVVVKTEGKEVPESTLREVAQFTLSHSSVWKAGQAEGECYWVLPEQVSKTPEPGEFLPKGSFVIRGKRNYIKTGVGIAVGIREGMCMGGPTKAIQDRVDMMFELEPGEFNQNDMSTKIYRMLSEKVGDARSLKTYASPDIIAKFLPPGGSRIKSQKT